MIYWLPASWIPDPGVNTTGAAMVRESARERLRLSLEVGPQRHQNFVGQAPAGDQASTVSIMRRRVSTSKGLSNTADTPLCCSAAIRF